MFAGFARPITRSFRQLPMGEFRRWGPGCIVSAGTDPVRELKTSSELLALLRLNVYCLAPVATSFCGSGDGFRRLRSRNMASSRSAKALSRGTADNQVNVRSQDRPAVHLRRLTRGKLLSSMYVCIALVICWNARACRLSWLLSNGAGKTSSAHPCGLFGLLPQRQYYCFCTHICRNCNRHSLTLPRVKKKHAQERSGAGQTSPQFLDAEPRNRNICSPLGFFLSGLSCLKVNSTSHTYYSRHRFSKEGTQVMSDRSRRR